MQAANLEQTLNQAGIKGPLGTGLAVTDVAANTVLQLLPLLAPLEIGAQKGADILATNTERVVLSPEQLSEIASRDLSDLSPTQQAVGERFQQIAQTAADQGKSMTVDARAPATSVPGKVATAIGGKNLAPFAQITEGGAPIAGPETPTPKTPIPTEAPGTAMVPQAQPSAATPGFWDNFGVPAAEQTEAPVRVGTKTLLNPQAQEAAGLNIGKADMRSIIDESLAFSDSQQEKNYQQFKQIYAYAGANPPEDYQKFLDTHPGSDNLFYSQDAGSRKFLITSWTGIKIPNSSIKATN